MYLKILNMDTFYTDPVYMDKQFIIILVLWSIITIGVSKLIDFLFKSPMKLTKDLEDSESEELDDDEELEGELKDSIIKSMGPTKDLSKKDESRDLVRPKDESIIQSYLNSLGKDTFGDRIEIDLLGKMKYSYTEIICLPPDGIKNMSIVNKHSLFMSIISLTDSYDGRKLIFDDLLKNLVSPDGILSYDVIFEKTNEESMEDNLNKLTQKARDEAKGMAVNLMKGQMGNEMMEGVITMVSGLFRNETPNEIDNYKSQIRVEEIDEIQRELALIEGKEIKGEEIEEKTDLEKEMESLKTDK